MTEINEYSTRVTPTWCPGCGNWGIFSALKKALENLSLPREKIAIVTDVGCSGNMADFINTYVFHSLHGRALPIAAGIKLANHNLTVIAVIGDGGCYGEGLTHLLNLMRGNHDLKILVHDNFLYSLTTGQYSPTTPKGSITKSTPYGSIEEAFNPLTVALANHATFCSRSYAFNLNHLTDILTCAIKHEGFSLVDILQPCITLNKTQTLNWYSEKIYEIKEPFKDKIEASKEANKIDKLGIGIFYQENKLPYHKEDMVLKEKALIDKQINHINISKLLEKFV